MVFVNQGEGWITLFEGKGTFAFLVACLVDRQVFFEGKGTFVIHPYCNIGCLGFVDLGIIIPPKIIVRNNRMSFIL